MLGSNARAANMAASGGGAPGGGLQFNKDEI